MDNPNTHELSSLYEAFPPEEARRRIGRVEIHHTPKRGSWRNVAETELSVLSGQCLDRRIGEKDELRAEVAAWEEARNAAKCRVDWQFTTADARIRLKRLYPSIQSGSPTSATSVGASGARNFASARRPASVLANRRAVPAGHIGSVNRAAGWRGGDMGGDRVRL